jgi:hypothetical protein
MNYLTLKLGCSLKKAVVTNIEVRCPKLTGNEKLYLKVRPEDGKEFTVNEVWLKSPSKELATKGLWLELDVFGQILSTSVLGRYLKSMDIGTIGELLGKEVLLQPKPNGFMCIVTQINL